MFAWTVCTSGRYCKTWPSFVYPGKLRSPVLVVSLLTEINSRWRRALRLLEISHSLNRPACPEGVRALRRKCYAWARKPGSSNPGVDFFSKVPMAIWPEQHPSEEYQTVIKPCVLPLSGTDCRQMDFYEDYQSPFDFDTGVNKNYLYLSPSGNSSPSGSPTLRKSGNY